MVMRLLAGLGYAVIVLAILVLLAIALKFPKNIKTTSLSGISAILSSTVILFTKFIKNSKAKTVLFGGLILFQFILMHDYVTIRAIK